MLCQMTNDARLSALRCLRQRRARLLGAGQSLQPRLECWLCLLTQQCYCTGALAAQLRQPHAGWHLLCCMRCLLSRPIQVWSSFNKTLKSSGSQLSKLWHGGTAFLWQPGQDANQLLERRSRRDSVGDAASNVRLSRAVLVSCGSMSNSCQSSLMCMRGS